MAIIHKTTLIPGKLELLAGWLPAQPWYRRGGDPELAKAGGFRLDDPAGEVGIEFMVVTDGSGESAISYLAPLTYRASALAGADAALVGTTEHGVLGRRWVYDGIADPVLVGQLVALVQGRAQPQAQSVSGTADPTVTCGPVAGGVPLAVESAVAANGPLGTELRVDTMGGEDGVGEDGARGGRLVITLNRVLRPDAADYADGSGGEADRGRLVAGWRLTDGTGVRGCLANSRYTQAPA
jgi:hypothetical protein